MFKGGDFRQCLPVLRRSNKCKIIESTIKNSKNWRRFKHLSLTKNIRAQTESIQFTDWLIKLGNGCLPKIDNICDGTVNIPNKYLSDDINSLITDTFGENIEINNAIVTESVILCSTNEDCQVINDKIINSLPGESKTFYSTDSLETNSNTDNETNNFPVEFLNSINISGLPTHKLTIKKNTVVMLIRNLNKSKGKFI